MSRRTAPAFLRSLDELADGDVHRLALLGHTGNRTTPVGNSVEQSLVGGVQLRDLPDEVPKRLARIVARECSVGNLAHLPDTREDDGRDQRLLRREAAEHRCVAHACAARDLVDAHVGSALPRMPPPPPRARDSDCAERRRGAASTAYAATGSVRTSTSIRAT